MNLVNELKVGIISDGKYGDRAYENSKQIFKTIWILVPDIPLTVILDEEIDINIPECDLYVSYVRHPDIIFQIAELQKPLILGITPGLGSYEQYKVINPKVINPRTMCSLEPNTGIIEVDSFSQFFGKPEYNIEVDDEGNVKEISVLRSSPCGSSQAGAIYFKDKKVNVQNLQNFALTVCHECRAPRFGHTCDKKISGITHILSFMKSFELNDNVELKDFLDGIKKEFSSRISS